MRGETATRVKATARHLNGPDTALRVSEEQFRLLVDSVTDYAIFILDLKGRVATWNAGAQRIKGYARDEIIGRHFSAFYTHEDRVAGLPALGLETARREGRWEHEGRRVRKNGEVFWAMVVIDAIRDDAGEIIGFAKITRDITERKAAEKDLADARESLFQAQKLDAIGQLTGGVAHDFNNLLMAIQGSLELVQRRTHFDPRISPLLDNALEGVRRGSALVERMLTFARRQELKLAPLDLAAVVRSMLTFMQRAIGPTIVIESRFPPDLPPALSDQNQLENALLNLAVNARDAMPSGGRVTISARREIVGPEDTRLAPGSYVVLSVSDDGVGMDEVTLARAMDPFFTTKGVGKGTGLGLSMVHGLAAQSGGRLNLTSAPGKGTVAEVWLVASEGQIAPQTKEQADRRVMLVVDDDPLVLTNTAALLEDLGYHVVCATSGAEALEAITHHAHLSLLITDYAMPGMTGVQLREAALRMRPGLPTLLLTGFDGVPPQIEWPSERLKKPFAQEELAEAVNRALCGALGEEASPASVPAGGA